MTLGVGKGAKMREDEPEVRRYALRSPPRSHAGLNIACVLGYADDRIEGHGRHGKGDQAATELCLTAVRTRTISKQIFLSRYSRDVIRTIPLTMSFAIGGNRIPCIYYRRRNLR